MSLKTTGETKQNEEERNKHIKEIVEKIYALPLTASKLMTEYDLTNKNIVEWIVINKGMDEATKIIKALDPEKISAIKGLVDMGMGEYQAARAASFINFKPKQVGPRRDTQQ